MIAFAYGTCLEDIRAKKKTKMKFLWQGPKIQIVSIFAHK